LEDLGKEQKEGLALKRKSTAKVTKSVKDDSDKVVGKVGFDGDLSQSQIESLLESSQSFGSGDPFTNE